MQTTRQCLRTFQMEAFFHCEAPLISWWRKRRSFKLPQLSKHIYQMYRTVDYHRFLDDPIDKNLLSCESFQNHSKNGSSTVKYHRFLMKKLKSFQFLHFPNTVSFTYQIDHTVKQLKFLVKKTEPLNFPHIPNTQSLYLSKWIKLESPTEFFLILVTKAFFFVKVFKTTSNGSSTLKHHRLLMKKH